MAIALMFSGCASQQIKSNLSRFLEKKSESRASSAEKNDGFNIAIILIACLFMLSIGIAVGASRVKRRLRLPSLSIEPFFMPSEWLSCTNRLYQDLQNATMKICVASYWLTHLPIIMALRMARRRNISIEIIFDQSTPNISTLQEQFRNWGIKFTVSEIDMARMHHKFIVIDNTITWVGSANLTGAAFRKNYENLMRIQSPEIAWRYFINFKNLMREFEQAAASKQKTQQPTRPVHVLSATPADQTGKPISDYQKKVLDDFGISWKGLNYDEAYMIVDRIINSSWRLFGSKNIKSFY